MLVSNGLDSDQEGRTFGTDQGPNCLKRLPADDAIRQKDLKKIEITYLSILKEKTIHPNMMSLVFSLI